MISRRRIVIALGAGALAPFATFAQQQGKVWRVGYLATRHVDFVDSDYSYGPFRQGMRELGYVEGKNLIIEWRSAEGKYERLAGLAAELVQLKCDVILASGTPATVVAQKATSTIPIVMPSNIDPVGDGFVKSLAHPGGNITGLSNMTSDLGPKHLEMLLAMVPKLSRVGAIVNSANATHVTFIKRLEDAVQRSGVRIVVAKAQTAQEIEHAFSLITRGKAGAVIVPADAFFIQQRHQLTGLAAKHRLPSISGIREFVEAGGLMSYGPNLADLQRRAATYVDKIFKGAKPGDLPVEQPTIFELIINGKTAKALGLTIPQSLLISADKVIE